VILASPWNRPGVEVARRYQDELADLFLCGTVTLVPGKHGQHEPLVRRAPTRPVNGAGVRFLMCRKRSCARAAGAP